jgi:hypothetical protein
MITKISKIRELIGNTAKSMSDEEVLRIEDDMRTLARVIIDTIKNMTPERENSIRKENR